MEDPSSANASLPESQASSCDRVPESPPQYTQDQDNPDDNIEDYDEGDAKVGPSSSSAAGGSGSGTKVVRKNNDCVINIEFDCLDEEEPKAVTTTKPPSANAKVEFEDKDFAIEECLSSDDDFPQMDEALLLKAVKNVEEGLMRDETEGGSGPDVDALPETSDGAPKKTEIALDARVKADDDTRKAIIDQFEKFIPMGKIYPDVRISEHNTVAFTMKPNYSPSSGLPLEPHPPKCTPKWDPKFVPMPYCQENVVVQKVTNPTSGATTSESGNDKPVIRKIHLWSRITSALENHPIMCVEDFVAGLKRYTRVPDKLTVLNYCVERIMSADERTSFFDKIIPFMTSLVVQTPEIVTCPLPILRRNVNHNISISQKQAACLLANAFFCTFPKRFQSEADMPSINFRELFYDTDERVMVVKAHKLLCIINYFTRITSEMPSGVITYSRKNLRHSLMPEWEKLDKGLTKLLPLIQGTIEDDGAGLLKVDFANSFIGGGALGRGAVQEEILFVIYPELILTRLFCEKLNSNEAVIITGCERFSNYKGYSYSLTYDGDYCDTTPFDSKGRRCTQIVAIDALYISRPTFQYHPKHFRREINKAYVGFSSPVSNPVGIATGKWGCGAFNGDPHLKAIIQLIAASHAGRDVAFFTFGDVKCMEDIMTIYNSICDLKIKDVWNLLCQYHSICCSTSTPSRSLRDFCQQYADGQSWQLQQEEAEKAATSSSSSSKKLKEVPLTHFYKSENRQKAPVGLDDDSVAQLINGIDRINSPKKRVNTEKTLSAGKRQREEELTEEEIKQQLLEDDETSKVPNAKEPAKDLKSQVKNGDGKAKDDGPVTSPLSSKRPKRLGLQDFYKDPTADD